MQHTDEELLGLLALQEARLDRETAAHLDACEHCRHELAELGRVVRAGRTNLGVTAALVPPPAHVWTGVARAVGHDDAGEIPVLDRRRADGAAGASAGVSGSTGPGSGRGRRVPTWLAVAAGQVVGTAGGGVHVQTLGADEPEGAVVASARLAKLGREGTTGEAEVRETASGPMLHVHVARRTPGRGFREVWLLDAATGRLVSVGVLNGDDSTFPLPKGLDLEEYPTVDISREPFDGDPAHSTDSIARGDLDL
jgi:hypothetical protein